MKRLRVLISSHEFSPIQGSECAVGWNIATRMAAYHDVTLLCADGAPGHPDSYRKPVEDYFAQHGSIPGLRVIFVPHPPLTLRCAKVNRWMKPLTRGLGWQILHYLGLNAWHRQVFRTAAELGWDRFDVVHQLTFISFIRPGFLADCPRPFFWGPVGGMYRVPPAFVRLGGFKSRLFEELRNCNIGRTLWSRQFRKVVQKAARIWTITDSEKRVIDALVPGKAMPMIETAPPTAVKGFERVFDGQRPLKLCWSGQHEPGKALPLLLEALRALPDSNQVQLTVLGEGPKTASWMALATQLKLSPVSWLGRLSYAEALLEMGKADIFIHTSYREGTPHVMLEALGWGLPVICHDVCGMAVAVNAECGIKVPLVDPSYSIAGFRNAILNLLQQPERVNKLSAGALRRAEELSWDAKVRQMAEEYACHANNG